MIILGIESAALVASAALADEDSILAEITLNTKLTHSQTLLPVIEELFARTGISFDKVDGVALAAGPGSFTGLRIGAATAKGLGMAWRKPLIAVPTLEAMAYNLWGSRFLICPIMDARRSQVYTALYGFSETGRFITLEEEAALSLEELMEKLKNRGERVVFTGDGLPVFRERIRDALGEMALWAPPHISRQRAGAVAARGLIKLKQGETVLPEQFSPRYLRMSQAERVRLEKQK